MTYNDIASYSIQEVNSIYNEAKMDMFVSESYNFFNILSYRSLNESQTLLQESFKEKAKLIWEGVKKFFKAIKDAITRFFKAIGDIIREMRLELLIQIKIVI